METTEDKNWASKYLLDPLNDPEPSAETGPGSHFRPPPSIDSTRSEIPSPPRSANKLSKNPFRHSSLSSKTPYSATSEVPRKSSTQSKNGSRSSISASYPSPPPSASPGKEHFSSVIHRQDAFGEQSPTQQGGSTAPRPRRASSLTQRFPGDKSHQPLAQLKKDARVADRAPHLKKHHQIRPDTIDSLDTVGFSPYHHEGPFDATYLARNTSCISSPVEALRTSNAEALKATPKEKILDSVRGRRPLDGVAAYAPGETDRNGIVYNYEKGENMMIDGSPEGGAYKRWAGVQYHPDDIKGKGEPSYSIEKALKEHKANHRKQMSGDIELVSRPRSAGHDQNPNGMWGEGDGQISRSNTTGKRLSSSGLKKRFGSLRRRSLHHDS